MCFTSLELSPHSQGKQMSGLNKQPTSAVTLQKRGCPCLARAPHLLGGTPHTATPWSHNELTLKEFSSKALLCLLPSKAVTSCKKMAGEVWFCPVSFYCSRMSAFSPLFICFPELHFRSFAEWNGYDFFERGGEKRKDKRLIRLL